MTIKYNNKVIAGKYREQVIPFANTIDAGIAKIATQEQINEGTDNTSIVTPVYLAQKQDKLTAGEGIDIDATNTISSKVLPDKVTIVENDNKTLSTVARKTINEKLVFDWEGTEAEYHQAIMNGEIDPDWYCYITDDELSVSYNDVLSRTLVNIAPDGVKVLGASNAYLTNDVYIDEAGYNQLLELKNSATQNGVDNITVNETLVAIPYVLAHTGSKITDAQYRDILVDFYNENGYTNYFTIDEENKNYTLPMGEIYGKLVDRDLSDISEIAKDIIKDIAGVSFDLFDTKIADHELSLEESMGWALQGTYVYKEAITGERFGYPTFYERCVQEKNAGTATSVTLGSSTITMYVNDNGHQFYNIADKSIVDTYYTSFGIADFYGVDEENECIFLPRNKWFMQLTDDTANVNKFTDAGLPNITGEYSNTSRAELYPSGSMTFKGALQRGASNKNTVSTANNYTGYGFKFDASASNPIYGNSDTVQPKSSSKLLYYCVGNTKADTSWVNVFAQVEEGIKEIYDTKAEVLEEVNALRDTTTTELNTFKSNSINDIEELRVESVNELETLRDTSVNELETLSTNNIGLIENSTNQGLSQINVLKNTSVDEIGTLRQDSVDEIGTLHANSINEIDTLRNSSVSELERKRVSSNESIITTKEESITEILDTTEDRIQEAKSWAVGTEKENPQGSAKYWAEVAELSSSNALFDTKVSDHILKDAEAYGWALQGTYVYSEAIFGEHLGYPDFYNKCIAEYTNPTNKKEYLNSNINTVGSLTNNNGVLSGFSGSNYGKIPNTFNPENNTWEALFKITTGDDVVTMNDISSGTNHGAYVIRVLNSKFVLYSSSDGSTWDIASNISGGYTVLPNTTYYIKLIFTGSEYILSYSLDNETYIDDIIVTSSTPIYQGSTLYIGCVYYNNAIGNPYFGSIDLNECYININGERWWTGVNYITKNLNGHKFYSIIDKAIIDNVYNQNGIADFYGIDEANQRILLPRNKYFHQLTLDTNEVNNMVEAGLPNITGTFALGDVADTYTAYTNHLQYGDGAFYSNTQSTASYNEGGQSTKGNIPKFDASRSNSIYGNSDTVQPQSSLKLLYYCVGNTKADTSWIKLVEQVENGIKDIEDKRVESIKDVDTLRENSIDEILSTKQNYLDELEDKRVSSNNSIEETKDNSIQELVNTSEDLIEETRKWVVGTEEEKPEGSAKYWAKVAELSSSNAIFDTKISDHILDEAEAHGWTLCGTKAYKEAIIGEHLGYPTFYETCLNEYEQSEIVDRLYSCNVMTTGILTNNDGVVNGFSASNYMTLPDIMPSVENWEYNLKIKFSDISATQYAINVGKSGAYNFLFGLNGGKFTVWISSNNTSWNIASDIKGNLVTTANTYYYIKYGFNGNEYYLEYSTTGEENSYIRDITIASTTKIYQPSGSPNIGYGWTSSPSTNMYIDLNECYINIDGERWWTGTTRFNTYRYKNGHEYYLEQDKQYVDQAVNIHTHNMYGINLEEQSIIIPHINRTLIESRQPSSTDSSWYNLYSDGWCEQGGLYDYGSLAKDWNVVNTNFLKDFINTNYTLNVQAGRNDSGTSGINNQAFVTAYTTNNFKTEVYGDGNSQYLWWQASGYTNLPNTKLTYTYMCTGNTKADTSWVNVVEQVAEGAKEIYDTKEGVLQEIDTLREDSIGEIDTLRQGSVNEVDVLRQNSLQEMEDKRVASNESIINTKEDSIQELVETSQDLINESRKWAIGTDEDNIEGSAKYWAGVAELSSSNAMFDIKVSDHVLKDSEAYGWGLQGTYIYREAVLNDHLGYPTFYDKCLEEYKNSFMAIPNVNTVGTLTNDKGVLSGFSVDNYGVIPKYPTNINSFDIQFKFTTGNSLDTSATIFGQYVTNMSTPQFGTTENGEVYFIASADGTAWSAGISTKVNPNQVYILNVNWDGLKISGTLTDELGNTTKMGLYDVYLDELTSLNWTNLVKIGCDATTAPFNGSIDLNESYIKINNELWWEGGLVYQNENGHQYFDISDKTAIDEIYNNYGVAWFYGIDEENKRILLPRNDWFEQFTSDINEVNKMIEAGLPNIEGKFLGGGGTGEQDGAFVKGATSGWGYNNYTAQCHTYSFDASRSNSIYGNSSTVQPPASKKLLYICTANTKADTSWMTLTEQVEAGIKEVEDKRAESIQDIDTLRQTSVSEIDTLRETSVTQVDVLRQDSTQEIIDTKNTSLEEINTLKQDSITEIDTLRTDSLSQINTLTDESIQEINTLRSNSIQEVLETKESFLQELEDKRVSSNQSLEETKDNSIQELITTSEDLINESRKWAIGTENENAEGSAKFWAETAQLASSNALFDTKISDHILEGPELYGWALQGTWVYKEAVLGEHLGYPTFYEKCLEEKENATSTNITLGSNTVAIYINNNGHQFYDITDKEAVDLFYSTYGVADYYGIDTENERIFLPRNIKEKRYLVESKKATSSDNTWYNLYSDGWLEQGGIVASGSNSNTVTLPKSFKDTSYSVQLTNSKTATIANYAPVSNITANNTFVVYSNGDGCKGCNKYWLASGYTDSIDIKDKFIYYCVGNTKADTSWINLVEQVQEGVKEIYDEKVKSLEEIDTLRQDSVNEIDVLKANSVQEIVDTKNNSLKEVDDTTLRGLQSLAGASNALTHNQITNCLLEVPQNIKLELTEGVLTLKAGSAFILPNGVDNFEHITIESDISRDVFGTTTSSNMFIQIIMSSDLKTANLSFFRPEQVVCSETQPETNSTSLWYDLTNNKIYTVSSSVVDDNIRSFPIAIANIENGVVKEISHIFNGFGYIGSTVWVDKGVKGLVPNGRNEDGTLNNIEFKTQSVLTRTITNTDDIDCTIAIDSNRLYLYAKRDDRYYDEEQNYIIHSDIKMSFAYVGEYHSNNCVISDFKPKSTFRAIDYNDITNILSSGGGSTVSITEEYIGENEGYRLYSNGYFEQWGYIEKLSNTSTDITITFAKPLDSNKWADVYYRIGEFYRPKYTYTIYETTTFPAKTYYNQILLGVGNFNTDTSQCISSSWWTLNGTTSYTSLTAIHPVKNDTLAGWGGISWADSTQPYFKDIHWHVQGYILGV